MSDNGGNHESGVFGSGTGGPLTGTALAGMGQPGQGDNIHYGGGWAHVSNTPLKLFKHFTHEGGIRAPCIIHWPAGFAARNAWCEAPTHLIDIVATLEDAAGAAHPASFGGHAVLPLEGVSLLPLLDGQSIAERPLFVEHESNRAIRKGKWKLVTEAFTAFDDEFAAHQKLLYDMDADPGETTDLAAANPAKVIELVDEWNAWATRVGLPAGRLMARPPDNRTPATTPADLFLDTFNRADATDVDAAGDGMSGSRVPPLGAGTAWFEGFEGSGTADSIQVVDGVLQMATGSGMSESGLNHNFIGQDILDAGGFSVSLRMAGRPRRRRGRLYLSEQHRPRRLAAGKRDRAGRRPAARKPRLRGGDARPAGRAGRRVRAHLPAHRSRFVNPAATGTSPGSTAAARRRSRAR